MTGNRVWLRPDGIIEIRVQGDQNVDTVQAMGNETISLADTLTAAHKPVRVLDVLFEMGKVPPEARKRVVDLVKNLEYERLAMVGNNGMLQLGANLMLHATGKGARVKFFTDIRQAVIWLGG